MRKPLGAKERWEIFQRDSFTCQYCGAHGQSAVLQVDHVISVVDGGDNDWRNLKTACAECNAGKGAESLYRYDNFVSDVQRKEWASARYSLEVVAVAKFRGVNRPWLARLLVGVQPLRALHSIEVAEDWEHLVALLNHDSFVELMADVLPEEWLERRRKFEAETWGKVFRQWARIRSVSGEQEA